MWITVVLLAGITGALCAPASPSLRAVSMDTTIAGFFRQGDRDNDGIYSLAEAWAEILAMDRDGDNKVSLSEYTARLHSIDPTMVPDAPRFFAKEDIDKDGYIDQQDVNKIYAQVDTDGNGQVTMSEFSAFFKTFFGDLVFGTTGPTTGVPSNKSMDSLMMELFRQGDKNNDSIYSLSEAWAEMLAMDLNGDQKISLPEYTARLHQIEPTMVHEAPNFFAKEDSDHDGYIDQHDRNQTYTLVDTDGNGQVTISEFEAFAQKLFADIGFGTTGPTTVTGGLGNKSIDTLIAEFFKQGDTNNDGVYTLDEAWAGYLSMDLNGDQRISLPEYTARLYHDAPTMVSEAPNFFAKEDVNHDGHIDQQDINHIYALVDTDGNGNVSMSEFAVFTKKFFSELGIGNTGPTTVGFINATLDSALVAAFKEVDTDGNGILSFDEQWAQILLLDKDGDNRVSVTEYMVTYANGTSEQKASGRTIFKQFDFDKDGYFEESDIRKGLALLDSDGDGHLTQSEFVAYLKQLLGQTVTTVPSFTVSPSP